MKEQEFDAIDFPGFLEVDNENRVINFMMKGKIDLAKTPLYVHRSTRAMTLLRILDIKGWFRTEAEFLKFSQKMRQKYKASRTLIYMGYDAPIYPAYPIETVLYEAIHSLKNSKFDVKKYKARVKAAVYKKRGEIITDEDLYNRTL